MDGRLRLPEYRLQFLASLLKRNVAQVACPMRQQIEKHNRRRNLLGKHLDARRRRMKTKLQRVKIQRAVLCNNDFSIEHTSHWQMLEQRIDQFREVAI